MVSGVGLVVSVPLEELSVIHAHGAGQSAGDVPGAATAVYGMPVWPLARALTLNSVVWLGGVVFAPPTM
jgi:hypothetical protein